MQVPGVSFLICTYNGAARIDETLRCLAHQVVASGVKWEVILVANACTDNTAQQAQQTWQALGEPAKLQVLYEPKPGKQFALEKAVRHIQYGFSCIVDDDNRLAPNYLQTGYELLHANPEIGILGGQNTGTFEIEPPSWFPEFQHNYAVGPQIDYLGGEFKPLADGNIGRNILWGAGMFVRTDVWERLREAGFRSLFTGRQGDNNLTAGEDDELCLAALLMGYELWYSSKLRLQHHMAAGRLTEAYRNRLFYATARSAGRLNAYRNALWGKPESSVLINLFKDTGYLIKGFLEQLCTLDSLRADKTGAFTRMKHRHTMIAIEEVMRRAGQMKGYYKQVLQLRHRLKQGSALSETVK